MLDHKTEMGGQDNSTRCHSPRCPLCLLQQGLGLDSWSPSHIMFFTTTPSWPGYCSLLCFLHQQHQPWQCQQGVPDDMRHHQICVIFFHAFLAWGSTMHPQQDLLAWCLGMQHPLLYGNWCNHQCP